MQRSPEWPQIAEDIWNLKYCLRTPDGAPLDADVDSTFQRVAEAAAEAESGGAAARRRWADRFHAVMASREFLPAGRILAGAGSGRRVTLFNCFVMAKVPDDLAGIFESVRDSALTMQMGGGIGIDFSTLRPKGAPVASIGADASGPVSFMQVWDGMCRTIMSAGARRGAMMATLRIDHPDIEEFIAAKTAAGALTNFNLSVLVTDAFMAAVEADADWPLVFGGREWRRVRARDLWHEVMRATFEAAEPGVVFIDRVNDLNNLAYCETIAATNPCGEQPLPPDGACLLGSLNLTRFILDPFQPEARLDEERLAEVAALAVRFLDDVIDISLYALPAQRDEALAKRRIGLGITGLADALIMLGKVYGSEAAVRCAGRWMRIVQEAAYRASAELAAEKGAFPLYDAGPFAERPNVKALSASIRAEIARHGIRNGCLTSIAPTGTISLLAGNVSSGIEPVFDFCYNRQVLDATGAGRIEVVEDYAHALYRAKFGAESALPEAFVRAAEIPPSRHLAMQAAAQAHVDSAISKTINCPAEISFEEFSGIYAEAYRLGLKGCTTYRPTPLRGSVLSPLKEAPPRDDRSPEGGGEDLLGPLDAAPPVPATGEAARIGTGATPSPVRRPQSHDGAIVYMAPRLDREPVLSGFTYKLKWPHSDHALYVTINDIEQDGRRRPFEIFINTRNLEHFAWTVALTRMISAVFRRGGDVTFVADELKAIFDPQGGSWMGGRYVPSLLAAIGEVIEQHMRRIGFLSEGETMENPAPAQRLAAAAELPTPAGPSASTGATPPAVVSHPDGVPETRPDPSPGQSAPAAPGVRTGARARPRQCPRCGGADYVRQEGCWVCRTCGFSRCD